MITALSSYDLSYALETLVGVSLMIALILLVRRSVARQFGAGVAYTLWLIPAARLVLPPLPSPMSVMNFFRPAPQETEWTTAPVTEIAPITMSVNHSAAAPLPKTPNVIVHTEFVPVPPAAPAPIEEPSILGTLTNSADTYFLATLLAVWIGGTLYMLARSFWAHHSFMMTVRREAEPASQQLQDMAVELGRQINLKQMPFVASSLISSGPLVTGLFRPIVLLPAWFEEDYDVDQQRAALAHELTHIKRKDIWALQMAEIFVACLWFNPLAYMARRAFRTDQEAACDSDVLKSGAATPHAYGCTLLKAVQVSLPERMTAAASLPLTHALKERMQRMTVPTPSPKRRLLGAGAAIVLGSAALIGTASVTATADEYPSKSIRIENGTLYLDGEKIQDRQFVLLSDPMDNIYHSHKAQREIDRLVAKIERESEKLTALSLEHERMFDPGTFEFIVPLVGEGTTELLGDMFSQSVDGEPVFFMDPEFMSPPVGDPEAMEAWEAEVEARAEAWAERFEAHAEAWTENWEVNFEHRLEELEARTEAWEEKYELRMENHQERIEKMAERIEELVDDNFGADFEARIEERHVALQNLAEKCRDASLEDNQMRVMAHETADGHTIKIACVAGGPAALNSSAVLEKIRDNDELCDVEKDKFEQSSNTSFSYVYED